MFSFLQRPGPALGVGVAFSDHEGGVSAERHGPLNLGRTDVDEVGAVFASTSVRIGGQVQAPALIRRVDPENPMLAQVAKARPRDPGALGRIIDINLTGPMLAAEAFVRALPAQTPATVLFISSEIEEVVRVIGGKVVVKAQVKTGGRGKAGGVKLARSADETAEKAGDDRD